MLLGNNNVDRNSPSDSNSTDPDGSSRHRGPWQGATAGVATAFGAKMANTAKAPGQRRQDGTRTAGVQASYFVGLAEADLEEHPRRSRLCRRRRGCLRSD